jgi:hypothetical protein
VMILVIYVTGVLNVLLMVDAVKLPVKQSAD